MKLTYAQAKKDFKFLESVDSRSDQVTVQANVWDLMEEPTKDKAMQMYVSAIESWFDSVGTKFCGAFTIRSVSEESLEVQGVREIADRYGIEI